MSMIEVNPDTEAKLKALAKSSGVTLDDLLRSLVSVAAFNLFKAPTNGANGTGSGDKLAEFRAWVTRHSTEGAGLSDEAISRASIYPDR